MSLYETVGTSNPNELLAKVEGIDKIAIPCEPGNGIVSRGTVMYRKASGLWAPAAEANAVITNQLAVLGENVDTTGVVSGTKTIAETAAAFRAGHFISGKVTLANAAALTAAVITVLRAQGIVFDPMVSTTGFDNSITTPDPEET